MNTITKRLGVLSLALFASYIVTRMFIEDESLVNIWREFAWAGGIFHKEALTLISWASLSLLMMIGVVDKVIRWVRFGTVGVKS